MASKRPRAGAGAASEENSVGSGIEEKKQKILSQLAIQINDIIMADGINGDRIHFIKDGIKQSGILIRVTESDNNIIRIRLDDNQEIVVNIDETELIPDDSSSVISAVKELRAASIARSNSGASDRTAAGFDSLPPPGYGSEAEPEKPAIGGSRHRSKKSKKSKKFKKSKRSHKRRKSVRK